MRGPSGQADDFKRRRYPPIRQPIALRINFRSPRHHRPCRGSAQPRGQGVALSHRAQIAHQVQRIAVDHRFGETVRNGQGKPGPLQQPAQIANLTHWQDTRRQPARHLGLGLCQSGAQFLQGLPAEHQPNEQPIGAQGATGLNQLPHRIICPMQAQGVDHQILRADFQRQRVLIRNRALIRPQMRKRCHHDLIRKGSVNLKQPILHFGHHLLLQEERCRAGAVPGKGGAVGQIGRLHGTRP